jgi:broad specificity phosphatase PhoE
MAGGSRIWLMRHGESEWNASGRWQGHADPPLSGSGRRAAAAAAASVAAEVGAGSRALRLFSSDLRRAVETAAFVGAALGKQATALAALRELDVGSWAGLTRDEILAVDAETLAAFDSEDPDARPGGGETRREIRTRVRGTVEALADEDPSADLLLVVHLGVIRALIPGAQPTNLEVVSTDLASVRALQPGGPLLGQASS